MNHEQNQAFPGLSEPVSENALADLHHALVAKAQAEGLIDIAYRVVESPVGDLLLAATPQGLLRVAFAVEDHDLVLENLAAKVSPRILRAPAQLDQVARELAQYFEGKRRVFNLELDMSLSHGFRRVVQSHLAEIGYGHTCSYKEMAELVGNPKAVRAVGTACATNPLPVVIPCHRVLRTDGSLGGYLGGIEAKTTLLKLETSA